MTTTQVAVEIRLSRDGDYVRWAAASRQWTGDKTGEARSATEAVWLAVDEARVDGHACRGTVAVYSLDGRRVAHAPLWAVPQYELLEWRAAPEPDRVDLAIGDLDEAVS